MQDRPDFQPRVSNTMADCLGDPITSLAVDMILERVQARRLRYTQNMAKAVKPPKEKKEKSTTVRKSRAKKPVTASAKTIQHMLDLFKNDPAKLAALLKGQTK